MAEQQAPRYLWIGCSDSRISANDVLGLDPGEVFVHRNIANIVHTSDLNILSVLEFAIEHLAVRHIIVCGHYGCSGVRRALGEKRGAILDHWLQPITMLQRKQKPTFDQLAPEPALIDRMCEINVEMQVRRIAATPIVENAWARGQDLKLHGWIYAIADGLLRDLGSNISSIDGRDALPSIDERVSNPAEPMSGMRRQAIEVFGDLTLEAMDGLACPLHGSDRPFVSGAGD
ncbi:MAG: carbonic anhydrase [Hyphomicrobiaceae bacterium]